MINRQTQGRALICIAALLVLAGCGSAPVQAPVTDGRPPVAPKPEPVAPAAPVAAAQPGVPPGHYLVKRGDTLYSIALENGADYRDVARWNNLDDPTKIAVGQVLRVAAPEGAPGVQVGAAPGTSRVQARPLEGSVAARPLQADGATKVSPKALRLPYSEENLAMLARGEAAPVPSATPAAAAAAPAAATVKPEPPKTAAVARDPTGIDFIWPAKGGLLARFAEPNSKGVDIAGKAGDPVVAAASGQVLYTGTGIRGFGKLIVIRHENGFSSVYAHNREILVKEGQSVTRGQRIAELGDTDADRPKLHFEIRKSGKPVDPMQYLPGERPT
ncbi:MAG: peptidoglycan DD-metalloendopeptidase family protein [Betaproteobacteria bacterium]|nr:peptidoglycan DD-metalloendopeptidase family protein [Betaproteobacteria bacterium]MDH5220437.1 peptidoglycan DD-metalloendopeptidase family protein [Betaproteobacteria bacterium]MDH5349528.1 peptidoglycan DD-metalloendopeptidase family protein [Betaproteobacteria bacterium]